MSGHSGYISFALRQQGRKEIIRRCIRGLKRYRLEFDAIACTGVSGLLIAPILADHFDCPLIVIRKEHDHQHSHCDTLVEDATPMTQQRVLFVDDFVSGGSTLRRVSAQLIAARHQLVLVLEYCYSQKWTALSHTDGVDFHPDTLERIHVCKKPLDGGLILN